jgi:hypothetical protein
MHPRVMVMKQTEAEKKLAKVVERLVQLANLSEDKLPPAPQGSYMQDVKRLRELERNVEILQTVEQSLRAQARKAAQQDERKAKKAKGKE